MNTALVWLGLSGATAVSALPSTVGLRTVTLVGGGRLSAAPRRAATDGWQAVWSRRRPSAGRAGVTGAAVVVGLLAVQRGVALGVAGAAAAGVAGLVLHDLVAGRRRRRARLQLRTAIGVLVEELAAGSRPSAALAAAAGTWNGPARDPAVFEHMVPESAVLESAVLESAVRDFAMPDPATCFARAAAVAHRGGDASAVLARSHVDAVRAIGVAWQLGATTGVALAGVIDRVADDLAAAEAQRRAVEVALAGPRSSAALLTGLPLLGVLLGLAMGARPVDFLTGDAIGRVLCCVGVLLDAAGVLWIRRIVGKVDPS